MSQTASGMINQIPPEFILCIILFIAVICLFASFPAKIGKKKGYSFAVFFVFGLFAFIPALITSLVVKKKEP